MPVKVSVVVAVYNPGSNMFVDSTQARRPIARRDGKPALFVKPFSDMEVVMGRGGSKAPSWRCG